MFAVKDNVGGVELLERAKLKYDFTRACVATLAERYNHSGNSSVGYICGDYLAVKVN
jgi:hypothetical protein